MVQLAGIAILVIAGRVLVAALLAPSKSIIVQGPAAPPQLIFACCDQGTPALQSMFSNGDVISEVKELHAGLAVAITDFSAARADAVRRLNQAGIPLAAWIELSEEQGTYLNADNVSAAAARVQEFQQWTRQNGLRWTSVGLDIEPDFNELGALKGHPWRLAGLMLVRLADVARLRRARSAYAALIQRIQQAGYQVQTYQMPFILDERAAGSTLIDRLLGTVQVRGNLEAVMLYTSFFPAAGSAMIWKLGPQAQAITVGVTGGKGALDWAQFSRDLIVAGHFARTVGVYNLEGCLDQGFLPRLQNFDWSRSVTIPPRAAKDVTLLGAAIETALWTFSHLAYFAVFIIAADIGFVRWRKKR